MFICPECAARLPEAGTCPTDGARLVDGATDPLLGQQVGSYHIAGKIGAGGMGTVYKAVQPAIGSRVAIKVLSEECAASSQAVQRFFAEAKAVNVIRHENIVNVLDLASLPNGQPYILMEYLEGRSLRELIALEGPLPVAQAVGLIGQVLDALSAAHDRDIVHRDIKPENVFVTKAGRVKVLDFGIAKLRPEGGDRLTRPGQLLGTPHYMAPEQVATLPADARTDIYAVGLVLFEALTGQATFDGRTPMDLMQQHVRAAPPRPSSCRPELPPALDEVVLRALCKDPRDRYPSAQAFRQALDQVGAELGSTPGRAAGPRPSHQSADAFAPTAVPSIDPSAPTAAASIPAYTPAFPSSALVQTPMFPWAAHPLAPTAATDAQRPLARAPLARRGLWVVFGFVVAALAAAAVGAIYFAVSSFEQPQPPSRATGRPRATALDREPGPTRIDFAVALDRAQQKARQAHADAKLLNITVSGVSYDGTVDVSTKLNTLNFLFASDAHQVCYAVLMAKMNPSGFTAEKEKKDCTDDPYIRPPRCSLKYVLQRAYPAGERSFPKRVTAVYSYLQNEPTWVIAAHRTDGQAGTLFVPDDCRPQQR